MKALQPLAIAFSSLLLLSCGQPDDDIPSLLLAPATLQHQISADGELFAVNAVNITTPHNIRGPRFIATIAQEFSRVQPGDIVISFDATQLKRNQRDASNALAGVAADQSHKQAEQQAEQTNISLEQQLVTKEFAFADTFNIDDVQIRSKLEILDSLQNKEFLGEKQNYLGWQQHSFQHKVAGELELLQLQQGQQHSLLQQAETGLAQLTVTAPHHGILLLESNWRGEKPDVGTMVFPGQKIGSIPDLSLQHIKLQVIEQEAIGLAPGQQVRFSLAAHPQQQLDGTVLSVAQVAQSRERRDPRKYIDVIVEPASQQPHFMPGSKVNATLYISAQPDVLAVPLQAIFSEQQQLFVWKQQGRTYKKQLVSLGNKNLTHAEVVTGLQAGDRIALLEPGA